MASNYKINWQDKYLCDTILANKDNLDEEKLKYEYNFWAALLVKYYIAYDLCGGDTSVSKLKSVLKDNKDIIKAKAKELLADSGCKKFTEEAVPIDTLKEISELF